MALVTLREGVTLETEAAASLARAERRLGRRLDINRTLASWDEQMRYYLDYTSGRSKVFALHPSKSMHCLGLATDSDDGYNAGVVNLLAEHGWIRTALTRKPPEYWHFDYQSWNDRYRGQGFPAGLEENDMTPQEAARLVRVEDTLAIVKASVENIAAHLYLGGTDAARDDYAGAPGTVYNLVKAPQPVVRSAASQPVALPTDNSAVPIDQIQDNADTNTIVRGLAASVASLAAAVAKLQPPKA